MTTSAAILPDPTWPDPAGEAQAPSPDPTPPRPDSTGGRVEATPAAHPATDPTRPAPDPDGDELGGSGRRWSRRDRRTPDDRRDWVVDLGMAVGGLAAIVASFAALRGLAHDTGWGRLDWLLPVDLDTVVVTATRVWQSKHTRSRRVREFAAKIAVGAIALSLAGNACYHAIHANAWDLGDRGWLLVVLVSSIPPVSIALISHLAVLRGRDREFASQEAEEAARPAPAPTSPRPAPVESAPAHPASPATVAPDPTPAVPDPTGAEAPRPASDTPAPPDSDPTAPEPVLASEAGEQARSRRPAPAATGMGEDDPLLPEALKYAAAHFDQTGRKIGADPLARRFEIGTKRSRLLRDAVHGIRAAEAGGDS